jgi:signal transduction histidine kinase
MADASDQIKQLRSTLSKMEIALSTVEECIVWTDYQGKIKWCNGALERLLNQSRLFLLSASLRDKLPLYLDGETVPESDHPVTLALKQRQAGKQSYEFQTSNSDRILEISWSFVAIDETVSDGNETDSSVLVLRDVTQQRLAERQLRESKHILEEQVNQRTQELQEANARLRLESAHLQQLLAELQNTQAQLIQAEKMSGLGQLVAGIAHEINNPVNFIQGNLSHLRNYASDLLNLVNLYQKYYPEPIEEIGETIEMIDLPFLQDDLLNLLGSMTMGTQRIGEIVRSLRNFSRLDEADVKPCDLHEGLESTLLILQHRLVQPRAKSIQVIRKYGELPLVTCHVGQINQVFMNIIANAIDAIEESNAKRLDRDEPLPESAVTICTARSGTDWVEIIIADNGTGMPEKIKQHIFNPFFTTKPVGKGTGMGMAISYKIITENHAGKLECQSILGEGTAFSIQLPVTISQRVIEQEKQASKQKAVSVCEVQG